MDPRREPTRRRFASRRGLEGEIVDRDDVGSTGDTSNMRSTADGMTAPTPEQMRALAQREQTKADAARDLDRRAEHDENAAALRAAADQLEAVEATLDRYAVTDDYNPGMEWTEPEDVWRLFRDLRAILTADTAPQEDRDE